MRGMREHIEKLNTLNTVVRQMTNILRHRLRVTARINDKTRRHLCKVIAQRLANAAAGRIYQHQIGRFALCGGELGGIQRLEMKAGQSQLGSGLLRAGNRLRRDLNTG